MKICWDNLENVRYIKESGHFIIGQDTYIEKESCKQCGEPYLAHKYRQVNYCSRACGKIGKPRSDEVKRKMSKTRKLKELSKGKNNPMYGRKRVLSEETKKKISVKLSKLRTGKNNTMYGKYGPLSPTWKGGISYEPYCYEWSFKEFKEMIKGRDGNRCLNPDCFRNVHKLCVHHIDYNKKNCETQNLITLCNGCNSRANKDRKWHKSWYKAIINRRYGNGSSHNNVSL